MIIVSHEKCAFVSQYKVLHVKPTANHYRFFSASLIVARVFFSGISVHIHVLLLFFEVMSLVFNKMNKKKVERL